MKEKSIDRNLEILKKHYGVDKNVIDLYHKYKWLNVAICENCGGIDQPLLFSVGLPERFIVPNLVIIGLPLKVAHMFIYEIIYYEKLKKNKLLYNIVAGGYPMVLVDANNTLKELCGYKNEDELLVVIPCDRNGEFPWDNKDSEMKDIFEAINKMVEADIFSKEFGNTIDG